MWRLSWQTNFSESAKLGSFSGCNHQDGTQSAYCTGLPKDLQSQWWAYPYPWPDTSTEDGKTVQGYYDPATTIWISGDAMHIRLYRAGSWLHAAAVLPKAAIGLLYGKYVMRFRVAPNPSKGYKSADMLWPTNSQVFDEVDFPEGIWNSNFCAHIHSSYESNQRNICLDTSCVSGWHTTEIDWAPNRLAFYLDGKEVGSAVGKWVPDTPMSWIIQNESSLGAGAPRYSSAQIDIDYMAVYSYR
jgi:hypothetical protein